MKLLGIIVMLLGTTVSGQQPVGDLSRIPRHGQIRSIASFDAIETSYLAVLYWIDAPASEPDYELLVLFEATPVLREVFRLKSGPADSWMQVRAFPSGTFAAFVVEKSDGITNHDGDLVVARVAGAFVTAFEGSVGEYVDVNSDGYAEILASSWPDGDGFPTATRVHVWNGKQFLHAGTVPWRSRLSTRSAQIANKIRRR